MFAGEAAPETLMDFGLFQRAVREYLSALPRT
jgi:hypothetical protein